MKQLTENQLLVITALCSLFLSLWLSVSNDIISRDSTLYLYVAQTFLDNGFVAAFKHWSWPFYPIFFAIVSQLTGLNLENSAYLLNTILNIIVCVMFVKVYSRIAFDGHRLWIAALFILTFTGFNDYRGDIIRGYGFWAFTLLALNYYLAFFQRVQQGKKQSLKITDAIKWQIAIFVAALFRPEAIIFALAAPLFFLVYPRNSFKQRVVSVALLSSFILVTISIFVLTFIFSTDFQQFMLSHMPVQADYISPSFLLGSFNQGVDNFIKHVLVFDFSAKYAGLILASGLMTMLLYKILLNLGLVYAGIWATGAYQQWIKLKPESWVVLYFAIIALAILMSLNFSRFYVSSRYIVMMVILLGLIVAQYLDVLFYRLAQNKKKWLLNALVVYIIIQLLDSVISIGASKAPIKDIALWAVKEIPEQVKIGCNEPRFNYYANKRCIDISRIQDYFTESNINQLKQRDIHYLLLWVKHKDKSMKEKLNNNQHLKMIKEFKNRKNDVGVLYEIQ